MSIDFGIVFVNQLLRMVSPKQNRIHVKWGEKFAISIKGLPLCQRTGEEIVVYFNDNTGMEGETGP